MRDFTSFYFQGLLTFWATLLTLWLSPYSIAKATPSSQVGYVNCEQQLDLVEKTEKLSTAAIPISDHASATSVLPPGWLAAPFALLLLMIATGPLLYGKFWHKHYPKVAMLLAAFVIAYYLFALGDLLKPLEALAEYVQFIALIAALYIASGGILININKQATPLTNLGLLFAGAVIANLIGTTGASMLLIRPYIRLNQGRIKAYHIVFFIFIISNLGGALTPIGDPPLFLGFLSGVPFFWTLQHNFFPWLLALLLLGGFFYLLDSKNTSTPEEFRVGLARPKVRLVGKRNFIWLGIIIGAVFIDPNIFKWVPAIHYGHHTFSFLRELILLGVAWVAYRSADQHALQENQFSLGPLKEVVLIFIGIFGTMIPALELISAFAKSEAGRAIITHNTLYWGAGVFSSFLDNAPTYLNFSAASMATHGADILQLKDVRAFAEGLFDNSVLQLKAISIASVFFGAMTYIGNGPNFMVKAIAEQLGIQMPSFIGYILWFSIPLLLPILIITWLLFFAFA